MADFSELLKNQVFHEDTNDFEVRGPECISGRGPDAKTAWTGALVQDNGDVLFRLYAPDAAYVKLDFGGTHIRTKKGVVLDMEKKEDGMWEYLLPYDSNDVGPRDFHFIVDGARVISPYLPIYHRTGKNNNYVEIPDPDFTLHHIKNVPHGSVVFRTYWSDVYGRWMRCVLYLPAEYNQESTSDYPVVYLNNGGSENETTWINASKIHYILDNLIANGEAVPMVVVMTNTMAFRNEEDARTENLFAWRDMILQDTIPFIEKEYRVRKDKWNRAICGNSFGGVAAGLIGWAHPEIFGNLGFFAAPVHYENLWKTFEENEHMQWMVNNGDKVGEEYKVIFMSRGEAEYLTNWILQMDDDWLSRNGILHQNCMHVRLYGGDFTHDHSTFRRGFADFCRLLFRNTNRILGQHKPDLRGKWEPKGAAMSENNEKKTTDAACAKDAGKQEDWMEQKIGGVEKKEGKRVFVQPGEGLKMNEDGSAVVQITANPGDEVILSVGNSFEHPRKIQMVDEENIGLFTACVERGDFKGPQRVVFRVNDVEKLNVTMPMLYHANSLSNYIEFPDEELDVLLEARPDREHGVVSHIFYESKAFGKMMSSVVYTPPGYSEENEYPVLYFFHECGENQLAWTDASRTNYLFDNMIQEGLCGPFIMVEVDCTMSLAYHDQEDFFEGFDELEQFLMQDCAGYVESHFSVRKDKWHRAIAGIGLGAIQAGYIGLRNTEFYGNIGLFTAFWPSMEFHEHGKDDPIYDAVKSLGEHPDEVKVFYRSEGDADAHYKLIEKENELMDELGCSTLPGYHVEVHHGVEHSWGGYRRSFRNFLKLLFEKQDI
ncbi:MAG: hypothetical protein LUI14_02460 [Lachnospiraceae bacterium]|nr:hypothetical protein [Lachnospiraceae bacterium]MCD7766232.1 hypothetical protein [Lachnospiraceae bacterium]